MLGTTLLANRPTQPSHPKLKGSLRGERVTWGMGRCCKVKLWASQFTGFLHRTWVW